MILEGIITFLRTDLDCLKSEMAGWSPSKEQGGAQTSPNPKKNHFIIVNNT